MRTAIIGAGPTGLLLGSGLARRGHTVTLVDRDPGPPESGRWDRRGVMQFHHAHAVRAQAVEAVRNEVPAAYDRVREAGAEPATLPLPDGSTRLMGLRCRRETFETALRLTVAVTPGVTIRKGHVDGVLRDDGRATGLRVDGATLDADIVIDASGRSGRSTRELREPPSAGSTCGIAYVDRQYQLHEGAEPGPMLNPLAWQADFDGYQVILFLHERGIFSVLIVRPTSDRDLVDLRFTAAFDAACAAIPGLATWTDPGRARPITEVLPGGTLQNYYRSQRGPDGGPALNGLYFVGDAVCTTTPNFGRGLATSLMQAQEFLRLFDQHDGAGFVEEFDQWCETRMKPWVVDHELMDGALARRWAGEDVDLGRRIPSDLIMAAAAVDPRIGPAIGPYASMLGLPAVLDAVEPMARAVYESGWRPTTSDGPDRRDLVALVGRALAG